MDVGPSETRASSSPSHPLDPGGFAPGHILANRYRIVALVGRGGMGEVYRADDLKLGQPVALKFLPAELERDPAARERLLAEVRSARMVSHPNVCRVHDVGDIGGRVFLTMEYIDGEDLASLLRRIGRLPAPKALEIARQLCAGLSAAHDKGVLHRDLKPANVMIDGRGQARITDFGLAVEAAADGGPGDAAGTVAYLAPERFAGRPATVQSDLYALGLILYETYTGHAPFKAGTVGEWQRAHSSSTPSAPSVHVSDIEPAVERAILRCLEKEPAKRPASATQVAAALPGGDPLAAAIAAGETPSPELVAASGEEGTLPRWQAWTWLGACVLALAIAATLVQSVSLANLVPFDGGPEILQAKARSVLRSLGYTQPPADSDWWTTTSSAQLQALASRASAAQRFADAARIIPGPLLFTYLQSPASLRPLYADSRVRFNDPHHQVPGDALVRLDTLGRLTYLRVVAPTREETPPARSETVPRASVETDWAPLLAAMGVSDANLTPGEPQIVPPVPFDARKVWTGQLGGDEFRIEAASFRGRIVFAQWGRAEADGGGAASGGAARADLALGVFLFINLALIGAVAVLAYRNVRLGRSDRRGASRFTAFLLATGVTAHLLSVHWVPETTWVWTVLTSRTGDPLFWAAIAWLAYLAFEPLVRRTWPALLAGWLRLLDGRWRDPLVGQSLLAGVAFGSSMAAVVASLVVAGRFLDLPGVAPPYVSARGAVALPLDPAADYLGAVIGFSNSAAWILLLIAFVAVIRIALRVDRLAFAAVAVFVGLFVVSERGFSQAGAGVPSLFVAGIVGVGYAAFLRRYGLLATAVGSALQRFVLETPWTFDLTKWFAWRPILTVVLITMLAVWGFRNVLGKQTALPTGALDG